MNMTEEVYYEEHSTKLVMYENGENKIYYIRVGYVPARQKYVAVADGHPKFCFEGGSKNEVVAIAERALQYYLNHGLKE